MGLIPLVDVAGFSLGIPDLWPMGIGAGRPRSMERNGAAPFFEFMWDDADRLVEVRASYSPGVLADRDRYVWSGNQLERSQHFDEELGDLFGDAPESERVWTWDGGRPVGVVNVWANGMASIPTEDWRWDDDGRTVRITVSNDVAVIVTRTVTFDAAGRLMRVDAARDAGPIDRVVELAWSPEGRLQSAHERTGPALDRERVITYRWDGDRLVAQTDDRYPGFDIWVYRY